MFRTLIVLSVVTICHSASGPSVEEVPLTHPNDLLDHEEPTMYTLGPDGEWIIASEIDYPSELTSELSTLMRAEKPDLDRITQVARQIDAVGEFRGRGPYYEELLDRIVHKYPGHILAAVAAGTQHFFYITGLLEKVKRSSAIREFPLSICVWRGDAACVATILAFPPISKALSAPVPEKKWSLFSAYITDALEAWVKHTWFSHLSPAHEWQNHDLAISTLLDTAHQAHPSNILPFHLFNAIERRNYNATAKILELNPEILLEPSFGHMPPLHVALDTSATTISVGKILTGHMNLLYNRSDSHVVERLRPGQAQFNTLTYLGIDNATLSLLRYNATFDREILDSILLPWNNRFVKILLDYGSSPYLTDLNGNTILHIAANNGNEHALKYLLGRFGAKQLDLERKNHEKHTAMSLAQAMNHLRAQRVLKRYGAVEVEMRYYGESCKNKEPNCVAGHVAPAMTYSRPPVPASLFAPGSSDWNATIAKDIDITYCDIDIQFNISAANLASHYLHLRRPVILRDEKVLKWKAFTTWTKENMRDKFGSAVFRAYEKLGTSPPHSFAVELREFLQYMDAESGLDESPWWLVDTKWPKDLEEDFDATVGQIEVVNAAMNILNPQVKESNFQFMIAPLYSGSSIHFHYTAANVLMTGRKRWFLFPPNKAFYSTLHIHDWLRAEYPQLEGDNRPLECTQEPGDLLVLPDGWGHGTISSQESVGFARLFTGM